MKRSSPMSSGSRVHFVLEHVSPFLTPPAMEWFEDSLIRTQRATTSFVRIQLLPKILAHSSLASSEPPLVPVPFGKTGHPVQLWPSCPLVHRPSPSPLSPTSSLSSSGSSPCLLSQGSTFLFLVASFTTSKSCVWQHLCFKGTAL